MAKTKVCRRNIIGIRGTEVSTMTHGSYRRRFAALFVHFDDGFVPHLIDVQRRIGNAAEISQAGRKGDAHAHIRQHLHQALRISSLNFGNWKNSS